MESNFNSYDEAIENLKKSFSDIVGYYVYQGYLGEELTKKVNEVVNEAVKEVGKC